MQTTRGLSFTRDFKSNFAFKKKNTTRLPQLKENAKAATTTGGSCTTSNILPLQLCLLGTFSINCSGNLSSDLLIRSSWTFRNFRLDQFCIEVLDVAVVWVIEIPSLESMVAETMEIAKGPMVSHGRRNGRSIWLSVRSSRPQDVAGRWRIISWYYMGWWRTSKICRWMKKRVRCNHNKIGDCNCHEEAGNRERW